MLSFSAEITQQTNTIHTHIEVPHCASDMQKLPLEVTWCMNIIAASGGGKKVKVYTIIRVFSNSSS